MLGKVPITTINRCVVPVIPVPLTPANTKVVTGHCHPDCLPFISISIWTSTTDDKQPWLTHLIAPNNAFLLRYPMSNNQAGFV